MPIRSIIIVYWRIYASLGLNELMRKVHLNCRMMTRLRKHRVRRGFIHLYRFCDNRQDISACHLAMACSCVLRIAVSYLLTGVQAHDGSDLFTVCLGTCGGLTHWGRDKMAAFFADDTFKRIFLNENIRISTKNSLKFVPKGLINNIPVLVLIMAWRRRGDKAVSEPMLVRSLTHICVTRSLMGK